MKLKYFLFIIFISTMIAGCSVKNQPNKVSEISSNINTSKSLIDNSNKDFVIRAEGISKFGNIVVSPSGEEKVSQLGADSSYGKSSDFTFNADYKVIFKDLSNNEKVIGEIQQDSIPVIIQPKNTPIKLQKLLINKNEVFIFIPQYSGSNDVSLYAFSVDKNGKASQLKFQYNTNLNAINEASILTTTSPKFTLPSVESNRLIIKSLMNDSPSSADLKLYKLAFKLNKNILILTSKTLSN